MYKVGTRILYIHFGSISTYQPLQIPQPQLPLLLGRSCGKNASNASNAFIKLNPSDLYPHNRKEEFKVFFQLGMVALPQISERREADYISLTQLS